MRGGCWQWFSTWVLAATLGCGGKTLENDQPSVDSPQQTRLVETRTDGTQTDRANTAANEDTIDVSWISEEFVAAIVVRPQRLVASAPQKVRLADLLAQFAEYFPADAPSIARVTLLIAPFTEQEILRLWAQESDKTSEVTAAEPPAPPIQNSPAVVSEKDTPELDHLFVGLEPEPPDVPVIDRRQLEHDLRDADLVRRLPPFAAAIIRFVDAASADRFVAKWLDEFPFVEAHHKGRRYYQRDVSADDELMRSLAFHVADGQTLLLGAEPLLHRMLDAKDVDCPLVNRLRQMHYGAADVWGIVLLDPIHQAVTEVVNAAIGSAPDQSTLGGNLLALINRVTAVTFVVRLADEELVRISFEARGPETTPSFAQLARKVVDATTTFAQSAFGKLPDTESAQMKSIRDLVGGLAGAIEVGDDGEGTTVRVNQPVLWSEPFGELLAWAVAQAEHWRIQNDLRRIGLAMVHFFEINEHFPDDSPYGAFEQAVSWRVKLLPYLKEEDLFDQYRFDEPWDSASNRKVLAQMPAVYGTEGRRTSIMRFTGRGSPFAGQPIGLKDLTDGPSQTIFAARAGADQSVPWTQPADLTLDNEDPIRSLGRIAAEGFEVIFFDGSVMTLPREIHAETLWRLINPQDGKRVELDFE